MRGQAVAAFRPISNFEVVAHERSTRYASYVTAGPVRSARRFLFAPRSRCPPWSLAHSTTRWTRLTWKRWRAPFLRGTYLHRPTGSHMAMHDDQQTYMNGLVRICCGYCPTRRSTSARSWRGRRDENRASAPPGQAAPGGLDQPSPRRTTSPLQGGRRPHRDFGPPRGRTHPGRTSRASAHIGRTLVFSAPRTARPR